MLLRDALLAYAHFLAILFLTAVLCAELAVYRQELAAPMARRLQRIDLFFGIAAIVVIVTGIARVVFGLKGADFYLHNPIFWTKMGLFLLVGLLSIAPTVHYLRWNAALSAGADPDPGRIAYLRAYPIAAYCGDRGACIHPALCGADVARTLMHAPWRLSSPAFCSRSYSRARQLRRKPIPRSKIRRSWIRGVRSRPNFIRTFPTDSP